MSQLRTLKASTPDGQQTIDALAELVREHDRFLKALTDISNMCIGEQAMGYKLDSQYIGEIIHKATGKTNPELNKACSCNG